MSRIGKKPVTIPNGIDVTVNESVMTAKKGNLTKELQFHNRVNMVVEDNQLILTKVGDTKESSAFWGTYRALSNNIFEGLDKGFSKELEINGVGYRASVKGKELNLQLGFSHPVVFPIPDGITIEVEKETKLIVKGSDKQEVGQVSAEIRAFRPPEPYKGKGVKYADERIIRKAGKTAKKIGTNMIRAKAIKRKIKLRIKRKTRVRGKIFGTTDKPRVTVFKSNKNFYTQVIDDTKGVTLCACDSRKLGSVSKETSTQVANDLSAKLSSLNISQVVFDKNGYKYHGVIASFVDALRNNSIKV